MATYEIGFRSRQIIRLESDDPAFCEKLLAPLEGKPSGSVQWMKTEGGNVGICLTELVYVIPVPALRG